MQRKFVFNLAFLLFLNILVKPFWIFGIDRTVQNIVPTIDYGVYFALFNFSMLFSILLDLGLTNYNNKTVAQNHHFFSKYFFGLLSFKFLLSFIYFIITFVVGFIIGYASVHFQLLLLLSVNQFLISLILFMRSNISGLQLFGIDSMLSVLDKLIMIVICSILLWGNYLNQSFTIFHFVYAQTIAYLLTTLVVLVILILKSKKFSFQFNKVFVIAMLKQTFPYALLVLIMTFYYRLDAIMIQFLLGDGSHQTAIYAQAYRLLDATNQFGVLFAGLLLPMFAILIAKKQSLNDMLRLSMSLLFVPASIFAIFTFFYSEDIIQLLYKQYDISTSKVLMYLMFCFVAISGTYVYGTLLTAKGSLKQLNTIAFIGLVLNFFLNLILIPRYKAEGAAIAGLITQVVVLSLQVYICKLVFHLNFEVFYIGRVISLFVIIISLISLLKMYQIQLPIALITSGVLSILFLFLLKIINLREVAQMMKKTHV